MLITYNGKINMIKSKSLEYSCLWICNIDVQIINWLKMIFQYEPNKHRNKTQNQTTPQKTTNNTTPHSNDEITKKKNTRKNLLYVKITYLNLKKWKEKKMHMDDSKSKIDLNPPFFDEWKRKRTSINLQKFYESVEIMLSQKNIIDYQT